MNIDFFLVGTALIFVHEMDAIRCREWRIFPGLSHLKDQIGMSIFVLAHAPLFYWALFEIQKGDETFVLGFDIFLIVHFFLHLLFLRHKKNEFRDWISWTILSGSAICGSIDLLL